MCYLVRGGGGVLGVLIWVLVVRGGKGGGGFFLYCLKGSGCF